jgi:hypothetical protein
VGAALVQGRETDVAIYVRAVEMGDFPTVHADRNLSAERISSFKFAEQYQALTSLTEALRGGSGPDPGCY